MRYFEIGKSSSKTVQGGKVRTLILDWTPYLTPYRLQGLFSETVIAVFQLQVWARMAKWFAEHIGDGSSLEVFVRIPGLRGKVDVPIFPRKPLTKVVQDALWLS